MLFHRDLNDLCLCIKSSGFYNFADNNTITATYKSLTELLKTLEHDSESAVKRLKQNEIIANGNNFQAITLNKKSEANYKLALENNDIESTKSLKLLRKAIDDRL